ncbi:hypothetical protein ACUOFC_43255, partial [Escherichia sp. TWPC-MK]
MSTLEPAAQSKPPGGFKLSTSQHKRTSSPQVGNP